MSSEHYIVHGPVVPSICYPAPRKEQICSRLIALLRTLQPPLAKRLPRLSLITITLSQRDFRDAVVDFLGVRGRAGRPAGWRAGEQVHTPRISRLTLRTINIRRELNASLTLIKSDRPHAELH